MAGQLDQTLDFCAGLGLRDDVASSRFKMYRAHIDRLIGAIRAPGPSPISEQIGGDTLPHMIALTEAAEFNGLLRFLKACDPDTVRPKLRDVLGDPNSRQRKMTPRVRRGTCCSS